MLQGARFEPGLVDRILEDVGAEPGALPLLEFALTLLWERQRGGRLTHAAYDEIGRVDGAARVLRARACSLRSARRSGSVPVGSLGN